MLTLLAHSLMTATRMDPPRPVRPLRPRGPSDGTCSDLSHTTRKWAKFTGIW